MQPEAIADRLQQKPFIPFRLQINNGETRHVSDPRWIRVFPDHVFIAYPDPVLSYPAIDRYETIPLVNIQAMEQATGAA